jgi:tetratricopeptide (TPR) repeat protein
MKQLTWISLILPLLICNCKSREISVRERISNGIDSFEAGNHTAAIRIFSDALKKDPWLQKGYYNRGIAYYAVRDYGKALADFNQLERMLNKNGVIMTQKKNIVSNGDEEWNVSYTDVIYWRAVTKADMDSIIPAYREFQYLINNNYIETSTCYLWQGILMGRNGNTKLACEKFQEARKTAKTESAVKESIEMLHKHCPEWKEANQGLKF